MRHSPAAAPISIRASYIWTWLSEGARPPVILPGAVVVGADNEAFAMGRIVDLEEEENSTVVHVDLLPVTVDAYLASADRVRRHGL